MSPRQVNGRVAHRALLPIAMLLATAVTGTAASADLSPPPKATPQADAQAPRAASAIAEILVIHATKEDAAAFLDPRIGKLPHLGKKPFSDYTSFKLVDKKVLSLEKGRPESYAMVTGRTLRVTLTNITADKRFAVDAAIDQPGKPEYLKMLEVTAAPNEPFFVGGQSYKGGTLILAITMRPDAR